MLKVTKTQNGNVCSIVLDGVLDEQVDLVELFGPISGELTVNCRKVTRINSSGVRSWVKYFRGLAKSNQKFTLLECSPAIVELLNFTAGEIPKSSVISICLPFFCAAC